MSKLVANAVIETPKKKCLINNKSANKLFENRANLIVSVNSQ